MTVHVVDESGANVEAATVIVTLLPARTVLTRATDRTGGVQVSSLAPGRYTLSIAKPGFATDARDLVVAAGDALSVEVSLHVQTLQDSVLVVGKRLDAAALELNGRGRLEEIQGTALYAGKKSDVLLLDEVGANLATGNTRQVFAKVAGTNIWENDGSGLQIGISNRGLDPNRSWEMNSRQNGYDITADIFGYPEAYFTPPLEAVERIEVVRGASSLQYGAQFGGLVNYVLKKAPADRRFSFSTDQTFGSNGFFNSHNRVGGRNGKVSYNAYYHHRQGDGWRPNAGFDNDAAFGSVEYAASDRLKVGVEFTGMHTLLQMAGGLTDDLFAQNPRASVRARNWFSLTWLLPSVTLDYTVDPSTVLSVKLSALEGQRYSLFNADPVLQPSGELTIDDPATPRTLYDDHFSNRGVEARLLRSYRWKSRVHTLTTGVRYYNGLTTRRHGIGQTESEPRFDLLVPRLDRDLRFENLNLAAFAENAFRLTSKLTVTPGVRLDHIDSTGEGRPIVGVEERTRLIPLFGIGVTHALAADTDVYGNVTQAYRATLFNDFWRPDPTIVIDPNLADMTGYVADVGWRGRLGTWLSFDNSLFLVKYGNRLGLLSRQEAGQTRLFWTNMSDSRNIGVESFVEVDVLRLAGKSAASGGSLFIFNSFATNHARYQEGIVRGNHVELAPDAIERWGVNYRRARFSGTIQFGHVGDQFSDANNTTTTRDGLQGRIPSYGVWDVNVSRDFRKDVVVRVGINNVADTRYFTRRATSYPGPGLIPADGRSAHVSLGWRY